MLKLTHAVIAILLLAQPALADPQCKVVRAAEPGWTDLALTTGVFSALLKGLGYEPQTQVLGIPVIYESLKNKDLDVFLGYWDPAMVTYFAAYKDSGDIETVKQNLSGAKFTFAVPKYVYDAGVRDFSDLSKHKEKFGGKLYGIEPGSNEIMFEIVKKDAFDLGGWEVVESSEQGMLGQVKRAERRRDWIVFLGWAPHPMNNELAMEYLTGGDDYYGPNFGGATVHTQVRKGYMQECPNIARLLTNLEFTVPLENEGMGFILNDGMTPEAAGEKLLKEHPELLDAWLEGVTTIDGKPALQAVKSSLGL